MLKSAVVPVRPWITDHHRRQFLADGYMVVRNVVPTNLARNAVQEIAAFIDADLSDRATWYRSVPELDGVVPLHHAQSLWDIRQCPNLYQVFTEFFGTPQLLVDINRCIFRPPVHPDFPGRSYGSIHWDADPRIPGRGSLQAVVLLTDVGLDGGGFQCLPQVYQDLEAWLRKYAWESRRPLMAARLLPPVIRARFQGAPRTLQKDFDFFNPGLNERWTTQVEGKAGDVILWSTKLPHGSATNLSNRPRAATFVTMQPCPSAEVRESTIACWRTKRAPACWRGMPGQLDPEPGPPAELSELGLKLIGALPW